MYRRTRSIASGLFEIRISATSGVTARSATTFCHPIAPSCVSFSRTGDVIIVGNDENFRKKI
jgi:hypothetical protein